jgi:hypothetical protein
MEISGFGALYRAKFKTLRIQCGMGIDDALTEIKISNAKRRLNKNLNRQDTRLHPYVAWVEWKGTAEPIFPSNGGAKGKIHHICTFFVRDQNFLKW